ncbi:MAG: Periplasmic copper-binding protein (NosD) [Candidatus Argoarchaeum ethanivorans]|uniref:Periplasmic copper-binding protein (NosD) n=1 Tax=Candidatus Argoarchaeum ethanivorans TaxID=2608793 RepID=A0A811TBV9_9EURY|nr:MAG: Periplasmic copper-binding protein (NosD) [Candidatus Argoarchaeum ethanivorans]
MIVENALKQKLMAVLFVVAVLSLLFIGTASGKIITVDDSGGADFTKIQDAINAANESDTIYVYNGSYYERISISTSLTIIGENGSSNILGLGSGKCVYITANNVTIDGFTIRNGDYGVYIENNACDNTIINNTITLNHGSGISMYNRCNNNSIINNDILENEGTGVDLNYRSHNNTIYGNNILLNDYYGIHLYFATYNLLSNNSINSNGYEGIKLTEWFEYGSDHNIITNNTISNNKEGIVFEASCYNNIYSNSISMTYDGNLVFKDGSNYNNITRNTVINGNVVFEDTYFNTIYYNNFNLFPYTVSDAGSTNSWDNNSTEGGNYWSGHICHGNPSNGSQPYIIDADSIDHYPFQDQNGWLFPVIAHFSYSPENPIINQLITFDASSSTGNITNYEWDFGDGSNAMGIVVNHAYSANRTYTVNLTVTADNGVTDTASRTIAVSTTYIVVPEKEWDKTFGGSKSDWGYSVAQASDGGYIITGETSSYGAGSSDVWLIKTDNKGNLIWSKTFGGGGSEYGRSVAQTSDCGYIIAGSTQPDIWLIKTNSSGSEMWTKTFGGSDSDDGCSIALTSDEGYIITGRTRSYGTGYYDVWLIKTDSNGNDIWNKTFGGTKYDIGRSVAQTSDGGYIITGKTWSYGVGKKIVIG